ncbi:MAG: hypothetical protein HC828_03280 [Blastochloris sp.]|nr:hypothetical protein [Blastochloris sp.]
MTQQGKQLSNPFSTGGCGVHFEAHVQALFVVLMLTRGVAPCLPTYPIRTIKLQGKAAGYDTDDLIISTEQPGMQDEWKLLGQINHAINLTERDPVFGEVLQAAWRDFNNTKYSSVMSLP